MTIDNGGPVIDTSRAEVERVLDGVTDDWETDTADSSVLYRGGMVCEVFSEEADARFIAWCREGVPALLARAEAAEARADERRAAEVNEHEWRMNAEAKLIVAESALAAMTRERDAERETVARLTAVVAELVAANGGMDGMRMRRAWDAARAALTQKEPTAGERLIAAAKDALEGRVSVAYDPQPAPDARLRGAVAQLDAGATLADFTKTLTDAAAVATKAREAALREAATVCGKLAAEWSEHRATEVLSYGADECRDAILALLTEKPHDRA